MRRRAISAVILASALVIFGALWADIQWDFFDRLHRQSVPQSAAEIRTLAVDLVDMSRANGRMGEPDVEIKRLLPARDHRVALLAASMSDMIDRQAGRERLIEEAFEALRQGDIGPAREILEGDYAAAKERAETGDAALEAARQAASHLAALIELEDGGAALNLYAEAVTAAPDQPAAWARLGHFSQRAGRPELAVRAYDTALLLAGETHHDRAVLAAQSGLGLIALRAGAAAEADRALNAALTLARGLDDRPYLAFLYSNLGRLALLRGRFDEALTLQEKAMTIERELGRREGIAVVNANFGMLHQLRGDYEAAVSHHLAAFAAFEALADTANMARAAADLGADQRGLGHLDEACDQWRTALPLFEQARDQARIEQMRALIKTQC